MRASHISYSTCTALTQTLPQKHRRSFSNAMETINSLRHTVRPLVICVPALEVGQQIEGELAVWFRILDRCVVACFAGLLQRNRNTEKDTSLYWCTRSMHLYRVARQCGLGETEEDQKQPNGETNTALVYCVFNALLLQAIISPTCRRVDTCLDSLLQHNRATQRRRYSSYTGTTRPITFPPLLSTRDQK